jgi:phage terminase large subunit-like protein
MQQDWDFSCPDWRERLRDGRSLMPNLPLHRQEADRAVAIFNRLRLHDVPGTPTMAEAGGDWFLDPIRAIHGSLDPVRKIRRVPLVFLLVPKKNNKTTGGGLLMLTSLIMNQRPNGQFALFGPSHEQSLAAYYAAAGAIELDPRLKELFRTRDHVKQIEDRNNGATLSVITYDGSVATGGKYAGWMVDELHVLGRNAAGERTLAQLRGARASITEQFGLIITTQSDEPPAGVFKTQLKYARETRDGIIKQSSVLPLLYEFPEEVQSDRTKPWAKAGSWHEVNPNLGRSVNIDTLDELYRQASAEGPASVRVWASQHLNIEIGLALHNDRWPGADHWEAAADKAVTLDYLIEWSEVCTIGIDGGGLDDLLGLVVIGRHKITGRWMFWARAWCDRGVLDERKDIAPVLLDLEKAGDLEIVDIDTGRVLDAEAMSPGEFRAARRDSRAATSPDVAGVARIVARVFEAGLLPEKNGVGLDPVGVSAIVDELGAIGLPDGCLASVPQGYRLTGSILGMARKLKDGGMVHGGQPLMAFAIGNAKQEARGNAVVITKQTAGRAKIDPLLAGFNAFALMSLNPEAVTGAVTGSDVFAVV